MPGALIEKRKMAMGWFAMHPEERLRAGLPPDKTKLRTYLGVKSSTLNGWEAKFFEEKTREIMEHSLYHEADEVEQPQEQYSLSEKEQVLNALRDLCIKHGNAFAGKTWLQAKDEFVEKQEVKVGLTANEIARRNFEAERQLRKAGYRVVEVQKEPSLLPQNIRENKRPKKRDNPI